MALLTSSVNYPVTKEYLTKNFTQMTGTRNSGRYTHFVPKQASCILTNVTDSTTFPIYECNCRNEMSRTYRQWLVEEPLLEQIEKTFAQNKPLCLYSLGSGACYQELSVCVGLAKKGFHVQQIVLVDTDYSLGLQDCRVVNFSVFFKLLFPQSQVTTYKSETEYLNEIKSSKQPKPDIILCIDVEESHAYSFRKSTYSEMLESSNNRSIFAYHNPVDAFDGTKGVKTEITIIDGKTN